MGLAAKSQTIGKGFSWHLHTTPCALSFHAFGDGHRLENLIHMGGSRCSGRNRREGWRHPNVALPGPTFFCVSHPISASASASEIAIASTHTEEDTSMEISYLPATPNSQYCELIPIRQ